ncbi:MAG: SRPBCC family protein [Acidimicrobiales bacterium]
MELRVLRPNAFTSQLCDLSGDELWPFVSDPTLLVDYSSELQAVRLNYEGDARLGSTFEGDQQREDRRWTTISTITALETARRFEWTVGSLDNPVSQWSFLLDEHQLGTTLTQKVVLCGGPSPMADFIESFPDRAEEIVHERLEALRERMSISVAGVIEVALKARR